MLVLLMRFDLTLLDNIKINGMKLYVLRLLWKFVNWTYEKFFIVRFNFNHFFEIDNTSSLNMKDDMQQNESIDAEVGLCNIKINV